MDNFTSYRELNWLLIDCFEAERRYYNASEDIQEAALKRFLYHESVNRNRFAHLIEEKLLQYNIEPLKYTTKKGNIHRNGIEIKNILTENKWKKHLGGCIKQDERCLSRYSNLLRRNDLPKDILLMLKQQRKTIMAALDTAVGYRRRKETPTLKLDPKIIKLRAI